MLKMMESYENRVQVYQKKEESMQILARDYKEKVEEALLARDKGTFYKCELRALQDFCVSPTER